MYELTAVPLACVFPVAREAVLEDAFQVPPISAMDDVSWRPWLPEPWHELEEALEPNDARGRMTIGGSDP